MLIQKGWEPELEDCSHCCFRILIPMGRVVDFGLEPTGCKA
jgi:hypothetical protein